MLIEATHLSYECNQRKCFFNNKLKNISHISKAMWLYRIKIYNDLTLFLYVCGCGLFICAKITVDC